MEKIKILILSANPKNTDRLRLDEEVREIEESLERSRTRERFQIIPKFAVRVSDLRRSLLDHEPQILHFSGYGAGEQGLVFEDEGGKAKKVSTAALAGLLKSFQVECVVLNACYSEQQAEAISRHTNYVMGMNQAIGTQAAIAFAVGFYDALGAGRSIGDAFEIGRNSLDLESLPEAAAPVLKRRDSEAIGESKSEVEPDAVQELTYENPEGQVPLDSVFYVDRSPIEGDCYDEVVKPGALIRVKAPRQMGKTSLMSRILHKADEQGCRTVRLNFQLADAEFLTNLDQFLQWFCGSIADQLDVPDRLEEYWKGVRGAKAKCTNYFQKYLLLEIKSPIALGLDEVDEVFKHLEIAQGFFGLLRAWHEQAKNDPTWKQLRLVIAHSKEVYIPLNMNQSPFNVGLPVELPTLTPVQVEELVGRHGLEWRAEGIAQLMGLCGGHPFLVRTALYQIARRRMTLATLIQGAATEEEPYGDHLRRHLLNLEQDQELLQAMRRVVATDKPVDVGTGAAFKLRSMGLVKLQEGAVLPSCDLYRQYFSDRLKGVG